MKYCNIVHETEIVNHKKIEFANYYNHTLNLDNINNNYPTLYIGWLFLKKCGINNVNILDNAIIPHKLYWVPSFEENKSLHINGVESFIDLAPYIYYTNTYKYHDIDPVFYNIHNLGDLLNKLPNNFDKLYIYHNDMIYLLKDSDIYGINLKMYEYFDFNVDEISKTLINQSVSVIDDSSGDIYVGVYKKLFNFKHLKRFIVCMIE